MDEEKYITKGEHENICKITNLELNAKIGQMATTLTAISTKLDTINRAYFQDEGTNLSIQTTIKLYDNRLDAVEKQIDCLTKAISWINRLVISTGATLLLYILLNIIFKF